MLLSLRFFVVRKCQTGCRQKSYKKSGLFFRRFFGKTPVLLRIQSRGETRPTDSKTCMSICTHMHALSKNTCTCTCTPKTMCNMHAYAWSICISGILTFKNERQNAMKKCCFVAENASSSPKPFANWFAKVASEAKDSTRRTRRSGMPFTTPSRRRRGWEVHVQGKQSIVPTTCALKELVSHESCVVQVQV